jgi:hypothetical protein
MIRADYLFSYWVFVWYLFYITGFFVLNPKFALWICLIQNLFVLASMLYSGVRLKNVVSFIIVILLFKAIPLWTLNHTTIRKRDIVATFGLFLMYIGWLVWEDYLFVIRDGYISMLNNKNTTPAMVILEKVFK